MNHWPAPFRETINRLAYKAALLLAGIGAAGLLSACQTGKDGPIIGNILAGPTYESFSGKFIDHADSRRVRTASQILGPTNPSSNETRMLAELQDHLRVNQPLRKAEPLVKYAEGIMIKLLVAWGKPAPAPKVIITADSSYSARVFPDGTVVAAQGLFVNADSEDELAFVLAHELAHVLLNHSETEAHIEQRQQAIHLATTAAMLALSRNGASQQSANNLLLGYVAMTKANDTLFAPSWRREQEDEADLLGLDLLNKAGYSYSAAFRSMQRLKDQEVKQEQQKSEINRAYDAQIEQAIGAGQLDKGLNIAMSRFSEMPTVLLSGIQAKLQASHPDPAKREESLRGYVAREYVQGFPPRLKKEIYQRMVFSGPALQALSRSVLSQWAESLIAAGKLTEAEGALRNALQGPNDSDPQLRLALYRLNIKRDRRRDALQHLEIAARDSQTTEEVFLLLAEEYRAQAQPSKALGAVDQLIRRFDRNRYLPLRIKYLAEAKRDAEIPQTLEQCRQTGDRPLIAACEKAVADARCPQRSSQPVDCAR